jgi:hypothetical protein
MTVCLYLCGVRGNNSALGIWEDSEHHSEHLPGVKKKKKNESKSLSKINGLEVGIPFAYCTWNAAKILCSKFDLQLYLVKI